jgi:hypothetical protein
VVLPDARLGPAFERSRAQVLLADDGTVVRRDGAASPPLDPGATEVILGALDALDRPADVGAVIAPWASEVVTPSPGLDVTRLAAVARHVRWHGDEVLLEWMLPQVAAAVERLDRSDRKGQVTEPDLRLRAVDALADTALVLAGAGQPGAARAVGALRDRLVADPASGASPGPGTAARVEPVDALVAVARRLARSDPGAHDALLAILATASDTGALTGPGPRGRRLGHDLAASAAVVLAVRALLVHEEPDGLVLAPGWPLAWYGGGVEVHDLPTAHGVLSYALRWHGTRPALLWDLEPRPDSATPVLRIPALDPAWSTTEARGDALLAEVEPPADLDPLRIVADHPDIDPAMRRPGAEPEPPRGTPVVDGGTFS